METHTQTFSNRISAGPAIGIALLIGALVSLLLMDIDGFWKLGLVGVLVGVFIGIANFWRGATGAEPVEANPIRDVRINSASIPIRGGASAGIIILALLIAVLRDVPQLRWFAIPGILSGLVFGVTLVLWRRHRGD